MKKKGKSSELSQTLGRIQFIKSGDWGNQIQEILDVLETQMSGNIPVFESGDNNLTHENTLK